MSCFSRRPGLPLTLYFTEELLPRFNVAAFCLELLQDVYTTKHKDSVLLVAIYSLSMLVTVAPNSRVVPAKTKVTGSLWCDKIALELLVGLS